MKIMVIYGGTRENGNTEMLTERVLEGLECTRVYLRERNIHAIVDQRHSAGGFTPVADDHHEVAAAMLEHDVLVIATPLYWYGMSGPMKDYVDRWSQSLRDARFDFKGAMRDKQGYVVITGGPDARLKGLPLIQQFAHIFDFVGMKFSAYLIGTGGKPGQVMEDERALLEAGYLNRTLKMQAAE